MRKPVSFERPFRIGSGQAPNLERPTLERQYRQDVRPYEQDYFHELPLEPSNMLQAKQSEVRNPYAQPSRPISRDWLPTEPTELRPSESPYAPPQLVIRDDFPNQRSDMKPVFQQAVYQPPSRYDSDFRSVHHTNSQGVSGLL